VFFSNKRPRGSPRTRQMTTLYRCAILLLLLILVISILQIRTIQECSNVKNPTETPTEHTQILPSNSPSTSPSATSSSPFSFSSIPLPKPIEKQTEILTDPEPSKTITIVNNENQKEPQKRNNDYELLPYLIKSFRAGNIDWHKLVPTSSSLDDIRLKESNLIKLLTAPFEQQIKSGHTNYLDFCDVVSDPCVIYDQQRCTTNQLCFWCASSQLCVGRYETKNTVEPLKNSGKLCKEDPPTIQIDRQKLDKNDWLQYPYGTQNTPQSLDSCTVFIDQQIYSLDTISVTSEMFYHFWIETIYRIYQENPTRSDNLFFFYSLEKPGHILSKNGRYFELFSPHCLLNPKTVPQGACFRKHHSDPNFQLDQRAVSFSVNLRDSVLQFYQVENKTPDPDARPRFCLVNRENKRFILNADELLDFVEMKGFEPFGFSLEGKSIYEQMQIFRSCSVFAAIHGSSLTNAMFLPQHSVVIQILPYKLCGANVFFSAFESMSNVLYLEYQTNDPKKSVFHAHFLGGETQMNSALQQVSCASPSTQNFFDFWINQDTIIDLARFGSVLDTSYNHLVQNGLLIDKRVT